MTEVRWIEPVDTHTILMITIIGIALVCDRTAPMHQLVARMGIELTVVVRRCLICPRQHKETVSIDDTVEDVGTNTMRKLSL